MKWMIPLTLLYPAALLFVTGHGYFAAYLPDSWTLFLATHNVTSLKAMLWWMTAANALKALGCALAMLRQKQPPCERNGEMLSYDHAQGTRDDIHGRQPDDGRGLHPFASRRERALSDLRRVRVLAEALSAEFLRASQHGENPSLREISTSLISTAKTHDLFLSQEQLSAFGEIKRQRSGESEVYASATSDSLVKVKDPTAKQPIKRTSPADWIYEHIIHNILFPDTAYDFVGLTEIGGSIRLVLRQANIETVTRPTDAQVAPALASLGLKPEDRYFFGNDLLAITDVSATSDNVLVDDNGKLRFIDPLIRLKKPATEVINQLVGAIL